MKEQPKAKPLTEFQQYVTKTSKMLLIGEIVRARASSGREQPPRATSSSPTQASRSS